jgi:hypothetical protein
MAMQKAASKQVASGKAVASRTSKAAVEPAQKVAPKKAARVVSAEPAKVKSAAPKKTVAVAAVSKPAAKRAPRKTAAKAQEPVTYSSEHRYRMVETAAYFIAERNGFRGDAAEHWRDAEREIARLLG